MSLQELWRGTTITVVYLFVFVVVFVGPWVIFGRIFAKARFTRPFFRALGMIVPLLNLAVLVWFASTRWPIERMLWAKDNPPEP